MKVLLIEDDSTGASSIEVALQWEGFHVYRVSLSDQAADLKRLQDYDIVLFNVDMETVGSSDALKALAEEEASTPQFAFWNSTMSSRSFGRFNSRVGDLPPVALEESGHAEFHEDMFGQRLDETKPAISVGNLTINMQKKTASIMGRIIDLTPKEFELLALLAHRKDRILPKETIFNHLYNGIKAPQYKIIDVLICYLRKKLSVVGGDRYIETVWGRGYVLRDPKEESKSAA